jgi:septin family protein
MQSIAFILSFATAHRSPPALSSFSPPNMQMDQAMDLRTQIRRFRILVVGEANAGKTTILKKICNSVDSPEIFSPEGVKVSRADEFLNKPVMNLCSSIFRSSRDHLGSDSTPIFFVSTY